MQALVVAVLEEHLYAGEHRHGAEDAYPAVFVALTSILGAAMARRLTAGPEPSSRWARWLQLSVYGSKLTMLLVPQVSVQLLMQAAPSFSCRRLWLCSAWHAGRAPTSVGQLTCCSQSIP